MSDLFDHLVAKANGEAETARPRPRLPFETADMAADIEWREEPDETGEGDLLESAPDSPAPRPAESPGIGVLKAPAALRDTYERQLVEPEWPSVARPPSDAADDRAGVRSPDQSTTPPDKPLLPEEPLDRRVVVEREILERSEVERAAAASVGRHEDWSQAGGPDLSETLLPTEPSAAPALDPIVAAQADPSASEPQSEAAAPTIRIGRIEVRPPAPALSAAPVAKLPIRQRAAPRQSLDEFLAKRRR